jgi:Stigma-specific protein, Stig1
MPSYLWPRIISYVVLLLTTLSFTNAQSQEVELQRQNNTEYYNTTLSTFLTKLKGGQNRRARLQERNCWLKPWICREGLPPFAPIFCCRNRCVNVSSDPDNCGFCGIRCPFGWTCCNGICVDTMVMLLYMPFTINLLFRLV